MSRIAGIHRPSAPRAAEAEPTVRRMLDRYVGKVDLLTGPHGALGRIARPGQGAAGDICETSASIVVLDGRILNAAELRTALPSARPGTAALIAALVERHGMPTALKHLSGDFALAIVDRAAGRLWLARDRFGVRPLYWTPVTGGVAFASQPRSLLMLPEVATEPDPSFVARFAASHYRTFDNDPEASPYRAIRQLPSGSALEIGPGGAGSPVRYWGLEDRADFDRPEGELAEAYRAHLLRAVGQRVGGT